MVSLCLLDIGWIPIACFLQPPAAEIIRNSLVPSVSASGITASFVFPVIAIVGTTIAPWQLFFQQSCVADKRLRFSDLKWARLDTLVGAVFTIVVTGGMVIVGNASKVHGIAFLDPVQMTVELRAFAGASIETAILLLMLNAAVLGTKAISLSSAWAYGEVRGWRTVYNSRCGTLAGSTPIPQATSTTCDYRSQRYFPTL